MAIEVELYAGLAPHQPRKQQLHPDRPLTAGDVLSLLNLTPDSVGLIVIDGVQREPEDAAPDGARVCLFPYLSGG